MKIYHDLNMVMRSRGIRKPASGHAWHIVVILVLLAVLLIAGCHETAHADVVAIAQSQIGRGEIGGDNKGPSVKMYTRGREVAWCAGFVSWVLKEEGLFRDEYLLSARAFWTKYKAHRVTNPRPGDIICFYRGSRGGTLGHVGIVEKVDAGYITTIEGNKGAFPAKVKRCRYKIGEIKKLLGFVRLT